MVADMKSILFMTFFQSFKTHSKTLTVIFKVKGQAQMQDFAISSLFSPELDSSTLGGCCCL